MSRTPRKKSCTNIYHVMARGLNKMAVFKQNNERTRILNLIQEYKEEMHVKIYAYCIMPNHLHLLIEAELEELASYMAKVLADYAYYYNYKYHRIGTVFQDRYRSQCVEDEAYFWNCIRYIHKNPVKASLCETMKGYRHCSIHEYLELKRNKPIIICEDAIEKMYEKYEDVQTFLEFHNVDNWDMFVDIVEEEDIRRKRIALELLERMEQDLKIERGELLNIVDLRTLFCRSLAQITHTSYAEANRIQESIRKELENK